MVLRNTVLGLIGLIVTVAMAHLAGPGTVSGQSQPSAKSDTEQKPIVPAQAVLGSSGCNARGCHGGPEFQADGQRHELNWRNAATFWQRHDPHSRAYLTLKSERSAAIVAKLAGAGNTPVPAYEDARCLACHVTPALALAPPENAAAQRLFLEGVACDACHTSPGRSTQDWYSAHVKGWNSPDGLPLALAEQGMHWLGTAVDRSAVCVGCHVGAPADPAKGIPLREVNHDLIAAGHPRLSFEYTSYLAALPPHWTEKSRLPDGTHRHQEPESQSHAWLVGQLQQSVAQLRLMEDQCRRPDSWPELAAFDCFACHHDLSAGADSSTDWRHRRATNRKRTAGSLPVRYPHESLSTLFAKDDGFQSHLDEFQLACKAGQSAEQVAASAGRLADYLEQQLEEPIIGAEGHDGWQKLLKPFGTAFESEWEMGWESSAAIYYALAAAHDDLKNQGRPIPEWQPYFDKLRNELAFPAPADGQIPTSPKQYRPNATGRAFRELFQIFPTLSDKPPR